MKSRKIINIIGGVFVLLGIYAISIGHAQNAKLPHTTKDGLVLNKDSKADLAYILPDVDWKKYKTIYFRPLIVSDEAKDATPKDPNKSRKARRESWIIPEKDVVLMQNEFAKIMKKQLEKKDLSVVESPGKNSLIIVPTILDIYLVAPIESSRQTFSARGGTYTQGSGSLTIGAIFADGETYRVLAKVVDTRHSTALWRKNTRLSNISEMKSAYNRWGKNLAKKLKEIQK